MDLFVKWGGAIAAALLICSTIFLAFVSAELGYSNPNLPQLIAPTTPTTTTGGGSAGANVTSVTSANGYIVSSPTTGAVVLTFDGTALNNTIAIYGNAVGFNASGSGGTTNIFNQWLNTTSNVTFNNITTKNLTVEDRAFINHLTIDILNGGTIDGFFPVNCNVVGAAMMTGIDSSGTPTCSNTKQIYNHTLSVQRFQLNLSGNNANQNISLPGFWNFSIQGTYFGNALGSLISPITNIFGTNIQTQSLNATQGNFTTVSTNNLINSTASTTLSFPFNGTGAFPTRTKLLIPHQSFDISPVTALDVNYNNALDRPIRIDINIVSYVLISGDQAYVNTPCADIGFDDAALLSAGENNANFAASCTIQPNEVWTLTSKVAGTGTVNLVRVAKTVL